MSKTRELAVQFAFADSTKRSLRFAPLPESVEETVKAKLMVVKAATGDTGVSGDNAFDYKRFLLSSGGATCTGIAGATLTITEKTNVYDSATYTA